MTQIEVYKNLLENKKIPAEIRPCLDERYELGLENYGRPLTTNDGRNSLRDFKEEVADAIIYSHKITLETGILDQDKITGILIGILQIYS